MAKKSDIIEEYICRLLELSGKMIELNRGDLAAKFDCSPSQINYVLETRFTAERGFLVESRRGGGGYLRVIRISPCPEELQDMVGNRLTHKEAADILALLRRQKLLTWRETDICQQAISPEVLDIPEHEAGRLRARFLTALLGRIGNNHFFPI